MSQQDLADGVRDLGGNDEDLKMIADADFSGSDWEDANATAASGDLGLDVAKLWSELSGQKMEAPAETTKSKSKPEKQTDPKPASKADKQKDAKPAKAEKPAKADTATSKAATKKTEAIEKKTKSETKKEQPKANSKPVESKPKKPEVKPEIKRVAPPQPLSKKEQIAWDKYTASLTHSGSLIIEEQQWQDLANAAAEVKRPLPQDVISQLSQKAEALLREENQVYFKSRQSDREFVSSLEFLKSGTFSDQLGTLSILSTESPIHSVRFIETLANKCEIKNRESACKALEVTKDLLVSHVLPDRRLKWFKDQPVQVGTPAAQLLSWAFEDFLKRTFFKLLQVMERLLADTVENIRTRTLHCVFDFFTAKPEQEANLLRLGLNKLGDPAGKVSSRVKKLLMDALQQHPGMKTIVANSVDELLNRTTEYRTRYYAVDTLSEFILSNREPALANKLVYIYLQLFERLLTESQNDVDKRKEPSVASKPVKTGKRFRPKRGKKGGIQQAQADETETANQQYARLVAKLFTGLNRAFPFSNLDPEVFSKYTDTMYKMSHSSNVGTFIEALALIFQLTMRIRKSELGKQDSASMDRYYRVLYESLLDTRLPHSSKLGKYLHLILKSMAELAAGSEVPRSDAFVKRMLQVSCNLAEVGTAASLIHIVSLAPHSYGMVSGPKTSTSEYDPKQRDPQYAKAETSQAWESLLLQNHYHPTVALYARNYLTDPKDRDELDMPDIEQYSINQFLSKWAYKKPKSKESARAGSIFQPLAGFTDLNLGVQFMKRDTNEVPASMQDWKSKSVTEVAPEEQFLYDYFVQRPDRKPKTKPAEAETAEKAGSDESADEIEEDEINEAMSRSGPGDFENIEMEMSDLSDDEEGGDLDAELAKAFEDEDDDDEENEGEEDAEADSNAEDSMDAFSDEDGADLSGSDAADDMLEIAGGEDDFTSFDNEASKPGKGESEKKRKRAWAELPTFLDADAFEAMNVPTKKPSKRVK